MNVSMHEACLCGVSVQKADSNTIGYAHFAEQQERTGTLTIFFGSSLDCQDAADRLAALAEQMREAEAEVAES
ncbi:hypothetical protein [Marinobacter sp.]|uniref:hypothetical protein n=1 Tax=Marinobacter sp. TaxID=50741 RepID=UPI0035C6CD57